MERNIIKIVNPTSIMMLFLLAIMVLLYDGMDKEKEKREKRGLIPHSCDVSYKDGNMEYDKAEIAYELGIESEFEKHKYFAIKHYLRAIYMCEKKNPPRSLMLKEKVIELKEKPTL